MAAVRLGDVTLTPQEIQNKEFREAFRGYNQDDVDDFLDRLAEDFTRITQETQRLRIQVAALQQEVARLRESKDQEVSRVMEEAKGQATGEAKGDMRRALVAAQGAADALMQEARAKADALIAEAEQRARDHDERTAARARELDPEAATTIEALRAKVEELKRQEEEGRGRIRTMLEAQLRMLDQTEAQTHQAATVERMSREFGEAGATPEPDPKRFWTEPT